MYTFYIPWYWIYFISILVLVVIVVLGVIAAKRAKSERESRSTNQEDKKYHVTSNNDSQEVPRNYCPFCGIRLYTGSNFCANCGRGIPKLHK